MSVFFNGRLLVTPTSASVVDDSALANRNLTVGNILAIVGPSEGGAPKTALRFGSPSEAEAVLRSGELLEAVRRAFNPSAQTGGPSTVIAVRANPATRASLSLNTPSAGPAINLVSTDYGAYTNRIKVRLQSGTTRGKKLTTQLDADYYTADNVYRGPFSLQYTGPALTCTLNVNTSNIQIEAPTGTNIATLDYALYPTVQSLVDAINLVSGLTASVLEGNGAFPSTALDRFNGTDIKTTAVTVTAINSEITAWFNSVGEGFLTATRAGTTVPPVNTPGFVFLSGGSDGSLVNGDYSDCFTVLQSVDAQWVVPLSGNLAVLAQADAHCAYMSTVGKSERRAICGMAAGTSDADAISAAYSVNSDRTSLVHIGMYDYDSAGALTLYAPYIMAAMIAGAFAGSNPGTSMTNKSLRIRGLERSLRNPTDTDVLIDAGLLCVETTNQGFKVVKSVTTWLVNDNYNRVEVSTGTALDFVVRNVREALDVLRGEKGGPLLLSRAVSITESRLKELARPEPAGPGVIVGDDNSPAYSGIRASIEGDVLRVEFQCSPVIPANYVLTTVYAVPYSGTATSVSV